MATDVRAEIARLYDEIHAHARRFDPQAVPKRVIERALTSEVFLVGQAPGSRTQRLSGIPYVGQNGRLSQTGRRLDAYLGRFGYTCWMSTRLGLP
jgi:uracil-DNA glycosylase